ncbi:MAG: hypothetical protein ACYTXA_08805 [Nostoc sp.]
MEKKLNYQCPILLYERLRQRLRYFDPSTGSGQASSVQVSTSAPCPMPTPQYCQ